ncbi:mannose-1-phosphate guanylyltransferase/mannose-6-phosphate isomerase [Desulfosalsimonas propionicica]|uniref:mannose-1-phosphate guanylyltransferase n=1 Tax=Desulfosalsimonas propionicica TaxID=332175 RepID=A0A7W0C6H0_9BACT|nr:mannose-1-phosphate guanylyltransferase/mannose-6-phosphate isomerase [Desulfosalsimonas propionicica]MBA2880002.1 mannose-1-phosphate guanylyltransferase/mannose-6-phosphate isomerase [Desulfosalsimonas propionicica]
MILPVVLSGGSGTRLWPMSRRLYPKQFLPMLGGQETLLQSTLLRLNSVDDCNPPVLVCNAEHRFMVAAQAQEAGVKTSCIVLEPVARNTAPAIAAAALMALDAGQDPLLLVLPADHYIADPAAFAQAVIAGQKAAENDGLVTFGILPDKPETGYGYIRTSRAGEAAEALPVLEFVEKPHRAAAEKYVETGGYLWNSGMFLFKASAYLRELGAHSPEMLLACKKAVSQAIEDTDFVRLDEDAFAACPADSIDYAVMEKTHHAMVVPLACGWSDIGSWSALHEVLEKDASGNACIGDIYIRDVNNSYFHSDSRLVAALGVDSLVLIDTPDAVMVSTLNRVQEIKSIVSDLKEQGRRETETYDQKP